MKALDKSSLLKTTLGILGNHSQELPRLIIEAHRLGIRVGVYADYTNSLMRAADFKIIGKINDGNKLKEFAEQCQLIVYLNSYMINDDLISYLKQFTKVPQGTNALDIINDRSIQRVFLNMIQVKSLSYKTVFNMSGVKSVLNPNNSLLIEPIQSSFKFRPAIINHLDQLSSLDNWFNGETYLVETLPQDGRYFSLTVVKSNHRTESLPVIEEHYKGEKLVSANISSKIPLSVKDRFDQVALKISDHLNYIGALTISFILTSDNKIFVDGILSPFNLINNVFNLTLNNLYQLFLRSVLNLPVRLKLIHKKWMLKLVRRDDISQLPAALQNNSVILNLSSLINNPNSVGYLLSQK